jgi:hypothetical protein
VPRSPSIRKDSDTAIGGHRTFKSTGALLSPVQLAIQEGDL